MSLSPFAGLSLSPRIQHAAQPHRESDSVKGESDDGIIASLCLKDVRKIYRSKSYDVCYWKNAVYGGKTGWSGFAAQGA